MVHIMALFAHYSFISDFCGPVLLLVVVVGGLEGGGVAD